MKKTLSTIAIVFVTFLSIHAQEKKVDKIILLGDDKKEVFVTKITETEITYTFPNESLENVISKVRVKRIEFGSGRIQEITEKIEIKSEGDWEKVIITNIADDVKGLKRIGEVQSRSGGAGFAKATDVDRKATEKIKRQAAALGAHTILILTKTVKGIEPNASGIGYDAAKAIITGVAYGY